MPQCYEHIFGLMWAQGPLCWFIIVWLTLRCSGCGYTPTIDHRCQAANGRLLVTVSNFPAWKTTTTTSELETYKRKMAGCPNTFKFINSTNLNFCGDLTILMLVSPHARGTSAASWVFVLPKITKLWDWFKEIKQARPCFPPIAKGQWGRQWLLWHLLVGYFL